MAVHGTLAKYGKGCRCEPCRSAQKLYSAARYRKTTAAGLHKLDPRHGSAYAYINYGCRCDKCRTAATAAKAKRRAVA